VTIFLFLQHEKQVGEIVFVRDVSYLKIANTNVDMNLSTLLVDIIQHFNDVICPLQNMTMATILNNNIVSLDPLECNTDVYHW